MGITVTTYDAHDRPTNITDPNGNTTSYTYDGFGDVIQVASQASGTGTYRYDLAGNLVQKTDGNGDITDYTYDALDRVLTTTYPSDATENVTYTYDQSGHGFGVGRLTTLTDAAGSLSRSYDERGNLLTETRSHGTVTLHTSYSYDPASRVSSITYPSGWTVSSTRDTMGRITAMNLSTGKATPQQIVSTVLYQPFGPSNALIFGNQVAELRGYDMDYRLDILATGGRAATPIQNLIYLYDGANNVSSITDGVTSANTQTFRYDALNRLTGAAGSYGGLDYTYDNNGNRLIQTFVASAATPNPSDGLGLTTGFVYNQAGRLAAVNSGSQQIAQYTYDAFGQRIAKTSSASTFYQYDQGGHLLEETDGEGNSQADYIYFGDRPIAIVMPSLGTLNYVHSDRLGTPQVVTNANQTIIWTANYQPFGATTIDTGLIVQNLRLPGQYLDVETGSNHNGFRDYVPASGRYVQTDPIGLVGGLNTYGYGGQNPLTFIDPRGESLSFFNDLWNSAASGFWAVDFGANTITKGFTQTLDTLTLGKVAPIHTLNAIASEAQQGAAEALLSSTASALHIVKPSPMDFQTDINIISNIGDITNAVGSIFTDVVDVRNLQNAVKVRSWIGESIAIPIAKQGWDVIDLVMSGIGIRDALGNILCR